MGTPCCVSGAADGPAGLDPGALGGVVFHRTPNCDPRGSRPWPVRLPCWPRPRPQEPWLQMFSLQTLAADFSGLWALVSKAPDDPQLRGRARGLVQPPDDLARGNGLSGQKECFSCTFSQVSIKLFPFRMPWLQLDVSLVRPAVPLLLLTETAPPLALPQRTGQAACLNCETPSSNPAFCPC